MAVQDPKILIVVGHALYQPWLEILHEGQLKTWASNPSTNIKHSFAAPVPSFVRKIDSYIWKLKWLNPLGKYFSVLEIFLKKPFKVRQGVLLEGLLPGTNFSSLALAMPDLDNLMNFKSFSIITGTLKYDYDFLVLTTTSSYLNIDNLKNVLLRTPRRNLVGGRILRQGQIDFASGSFRVFSRDVVEAFLLNKEKYSKWRPEDLAFGYLAQQSGMNPFLVNIESIDIESLEALHEIPKVQLNKVVHFRLKSGTFEKREDVGIMLELHSRLCQVS